MKRILGLVAMFWCAAASADTLSGAFASQFAIGDFVTGQGQITDLRFLPDGKMVFIEKGGNAKVRRTDGTIVTAHTFPVDTASEKGLLGVEVDPSFSTTRRLLFYYSRSNGSGGTNANRHRVVSIQMRNDDTLDPATETILVQNLIGPANHDGGGLAIGPDGKLYISTGDTGCNCGCGPGAATNTYGSCLTNGNGKILRVNLDGSIPSDNPLVNETAVTACGTSCTSTLDVGNTAPPRTDIWAWGFRNAWRIWFDPVNGNLWVGDVGEQTFEELNIVRKGKHYGWPWREGAAGDPVATCASITPQSGDCVDPVYYCRHGSAAGGIDGNCNSITMGAIVDSPNWPAPWRGQLFFADNDTRFLFALALNSTRDGVVGANPRTTIGSFGPPNATSLPVAMRVGPDGNLYVALYESGRIARIAPMGDDGGFPLPDAGSGDAGSDDAGTVTDGGGGAGGGGGGSGGSGGAGGGGGGGDAVSSGCGCASAPFSFLLLGFVALLAGYAVRRKG